MENGIKAVDEGALPDRLPVSVVVVNWNGGNFLLRLLASLTPLMPELLEVVVADNASTDGSVEAAGYFTDVTFVRFERNLGFAEAANRVIGQSRADWILLLNPDIEVIPESVRRLCRHALDSPSAAIVCGPLVDAEGRSQGRFQIRRLPTPFSVVCDALFLDELLEVFRGGGGKELRAPTEVEQPAAAYWLLRREVWESLGGFDNRFYPAWFEDVDFCRRTLDAGRKILYFPDCPVRHQGGVSVRSLGRRQFYRVFYGNLLRYLKKHHGVAFPFLWLPVKLGTWMRLWLIRT